MWCGARQSNEWSAAEGAIYCSLDCTLASNGHSLLFGFFLMVVATPIFLLVNNPMYPSTVVIGTVAIALVLSPLLFLGWKGLRARVRIPRGSRSDAGVLDLSLLDGISSAVACSRCDANLDLKKIGSDRVYKCEYCGATGIIDIVEPNS
jgi:hypothetical protein